LSNFVLPAHTFPVAIFQMKYKFMTQPLLAGIYEPEGIYLSTPFEGSWPVVQFWGQHPDHYAQYRYNGVPLKGHTGIDIALQPGSHLFAVDNGRVMEIRDRRL
jgi:hypothetical protein